jgi:hypothetical protein
MSLAELEQVTEEQLKGLAERRGPFFGNANLNPPLGIASVGGQLPPLTSIISGPGLRPMPFPMPRPGPIMPMPLPGPRLPEMPDYSSQFEKLGETLGGFGEQLGGFGKQPASIEQGQPKPQEVQQPQQPSYSPFGFGGLANLFMNMRRF